MSNKLNNFCFLNLLLVLWTHPFNVPVYSIVRVCDVFILILFATVGLSCNRNSWQTKVFGQTFLFIAFLTAVTLASAVFSQSINWLNLGVLYKFLMPTLLALCILQLRLQKIQIKFLLANYIAVAIFMSTWLCFHYYLVNLGILRWSKRLATPLTNVFINPSIYDSHLVSAYLAFNIVAMVTLAFYTKMNRLRYILLVSGFFSVIPLILSGGRTGTLSLALSLVCFFTVLAKKNLQRLFILTPLISLGVILIYVVVHKLPIDPGIKRTFTLDFSGQDASINARILKFKQSIEVLFNWKTAFFGSGVLISKFSWLDNIISQILKNYGLIGLVFSLTYLLSLMKNIGQRLKFQSHVLAIYIPVICYSLSNISTEFFLVTRSAVPVVIWCTSLYCLFLKKVESDQEETFSRMEPKLFHKTVKN